MRSEAGPEARQGQIWADRRPWDQGGRVRGAHVWADGGESGCRDEERSWAAREAKAEKPGGRTGSVRVPEAWEGGIDSVLGSGMGEPH